MLEFGINVSRLKMAITTQQTMTFTQEERKAKKHGRVHAQSDSFENVSIVIQE